MTAISSSQLRTDAELRSKVCAQVAGDRASTPIAEFAAGDVTDAPIVESKESYYTWMSELHHDAREPALAGESYRVSAVGQLGWGTVRVNVSPEGVPTLVGKLGTQAVDVLPLCRRVERRLNLQELANIRDCFSDSRLFRPRQHQGRDGHTYWIEARDAQGYRRANEWMPDAKSALHRCTRELFALARLKTPD